MRKSPDSTDAIGENPSHPSPKPTFPSPPRVLECGVKWSIPIARIAGTVVKIHVTFLLLLAAIGMMYFAKGGASEAIGALAFTGALFLCVLLHEFGHIFAARAFGIRTPDVTLLPIGGLARLERIPERPMQELIVALAGPLVNVVIALVLIAALGLPDPNETQVMGFSSAVGLGQRLMVIIAHSACFLLLSDVQKPRPHNHTPTC